MTGTKGALGSGSVWAGVGSLLLLVPLFIDEIRSEDFHAAVMSGGATLTTVLQMWRRIVAKKKIDGIV